MSEQKGGLANLIRTIYFYFFAGVGLILLIVGIFQFSQWGVKSFLLPKYNLSYEETRCDYLPSKEMSEPPVSSISALPPGQTKQDCEATLEEQRKVRKVTDLAQAITFVVVGAALFVFHFRKSSSLHK